MAGTLLQEIEATTEEGLTAMEADAHQKYIIVGGSKGSVKVCSVTQGDTKVYALCLQDCRKVTQKLVAYWVAHSKMVTR